MANILSFHDRTKAVKPDQVAKPTTFWTAVLKLDQKPDGSKSEEDYLWIKCHKNITIQTIREQYKQRNLVDDDFVLKHDAKIPDFSTTMKELDTFGDHIIALEAINKSDLHSRMQASRQPLQPSHHQTPQKILSPMSDGFNPDKGDSRPKPMFPNLPAYDLAPARDENYLPLSAEEYQSPHPSSTSPSSITDTAPIVNMPSSQMVGSLPSQVSEGLPPVRPPFGPVLDGFRKILPAQNPHLSGEQFGDLANKAWVDWREPHASSDDAVKNEDTGSKLVPRASGIKSESGMALANGSVSFTKHEATRYTPPSERASDVGFIPTVGETKSELGFKDQFSTTEESQDPARADEAQSKSFQLQSMIANASLQVLEASVEKGVELLEELKRPMLDKLDNSPDAAQWVRQIENLQKQAVKTKTIVGVVGNTGAGKSSVINAMLDEERLVPTNCMRACTAVVTEISYNYTANPYRAEIEFITAADWEKELKTLFQDLLDGNGEVSRDCANEDTDAGIAYAKIKAVYPRKTKEDISNSSIHTMLAEVEHILGKSRTIEETDSLIFYKKLQHFVDSKEKSTGNKEKDKKKERKELEFWPLIRVVRINVKAPALSTGAVIVDLPGVHDSNAARAAVAEGYMKQCTGLWVVAPINRAVDDKAAKSLLGESFKRQLKMDGGFSSVTFICSKTDDISLMEAQDSLGLDEEMAPSWDKVDSLAKKQKTLENDMEELKKTKAEYGEAMAEVDEQLEIWETLKDDIEAGKTVYAPSQSKKRKSSHSYGRRKKQRRSSCSDDDDDLDSDYEDDASEGFDNEDESGEGAGQGVPLTEDQATAKISELRGTKKAARNERSALDDRLRAVREEIAEAKQEEENIEAEMAALCISGRNEYSKGAIQQDFAAGIKELDQELAAEDDEENFNPDNEIRDYEEVARSLPVFCVSSRGYQQLQGRLRKDAPVPGFKEIHETGIPQLQAHCKKLTVAGRTTSCKRFIINLSQLLNSLSLWASSDGSGANMTKEQRAREAKFLQGGLKKLESGLDKVVETACRDLKEEFRDNIYDKYEVAISNATEEASKTASHWGSPVNRDDRAAGGYFWSTYKAICRRNGVYSNAQGPHDWNAQLADPMIKVLASGWEKTFTRRTATVLTGFVRNATNLLKEFHRDIDTRARKVGAGVAGLPMLQQQLHVYEDIFKDLSNTTREKINAAQKDINREFTPVIERAMQHAYTVCTEERGPGSYMRMKAAMNGHVGQERLAMFKESTDEVRNQLTGMIRCIEESMNNKAEEVFIAMSRDYRSVLGGGDVPEGAIMPKWQRTMRKEVMDVIEGAEKIFMRVAGLEVKRDEDGEYQVPDSMVEDDRKEQANDAPTEIEYGPDVKLELDNEAFNHKDGDQQTLVDAEGNETILTPTKDTTMKDVQSEMDTSISTTDNALSDVDGKAYGHVDHCAQSPAIMEHVPASPKERGTTPAHPADAVKDESFENAS